MVFCILKRVIDRTMEKNKQHNVDSYKLYVLYISSTISINDRLCGLVVRVSGYGYRGPEFDPRRYQIF
jgi:hypothetical protein